MKPSTSTLSATGMGTGLAAGPHAAEKRDPRPHRILDDRSRLACHLQWYLGSSVRRSMAHALSQAFMKRGLPRSGYHDNGGAMTAAEIQEV